MDQDLAAAIAQVMRRLLEGQLKQNEYSQSARDLDSIQDVIYWMLRQAIK